MAALRGEADGAALQTDLQAVGGAAAVLQYPTIQHCLTRLLRAGRLPRRLHAAAAAGGGVAAGGSAHSARQTLPHGRAHGQHLAEQTGQEAVNAAVCRETDRQAGRGTVNATLCRMREKRRQ